MYDGYFDKWSHSWLPTPTNPLSPIFALMDPYWLERKHEEDRPYLVSGPMFAEGTPWGVLLNPTIGALIKPEKELQEDNYFFIDRFRNGIDIVSLMHNANMSIMERARNFSRTNYISVNKGTIAASTWNSFNAPTPDIQVMSLQNKGSIGTLRTGTYGVYGSGGAGFGIGAGGGSGLQQAPGMLGAAPGGGYIQNIQAGFNPFKDDKELGMHLLADKNRATFGENLRESLFGPGYYMARHGDVVANEKGELGIYQNRDVRKPKGDDFTFKQQTEIDLVTKHMGQENRQTMVTAMNKLGSLNIVKSLNDDLIKANREHIDNPYEINDAEGFTSGQKLVQFRPSKAMELLQDADTVSDLMNQGSGLELQRQLGTTARLVGGIYGYMGAEAVGLGIHNESHIAQSSDMTSYTRTFWDANLGGLGGEVSEIGRRFIPNFQRRSKVNPLMNNMPSWLPERYRYGDPFASIPSGEARLPGKGYEALNDLHPDQYSTPEDPYGAFDRFKILADIAPSSPEYKLWREIAKKTVMDPELKEEMKEIQERARNQGKKHDFYNYNIRGQELYYENVVVSEILGYGKFRSGNRIFKMAGISVQANQEQNMKDVLGQYIHVGQEITIATDANEANRTNKDAQKTINAAVYVNGESVNRLMLEAGDAKERKGDKSAPAKIGNLSALQQTIGLASEVIGHLDIPIISDQWLRIRSPYESYLAENIYGTPYQSWSHPINTFFMPAIERAIHERSALSNVASTVIWDLLENEQTPSFKLLGNQIPAFQLGRSAKRALFIGHALTDRAALAGMAVSNIINLADPKMAKFFGRWTERAVTAAHILQGGNSVPDMALFGAWAGNEIARINEVTGWQKKGKYIAIGAAAATLWRGMRGDGNDYIPERVKKNWEMQDYWDRLTFLKYEGLYKEAARRAKEEEGVDVEEAVKRVKEAEEKRKATIDRLKYIKETLNNAYNGKTNYMKNQLLAVVTSRINELETNENMVEGGKYTQSALIYKRVADSTMYGLREDAGWSQIISALPQNDREYFMEFVAERDKNKREQILKIVSPSLQRALRMSWGMKQDKPISNSEFFEDHYLPNANWEGWLPDVDLRDPEVKTIENEAMNLSDFGFYESQLENPDAMRMAPLPYAKENEDINMSMEIRRILRGSGLKNVEVDVIERNTLGPTEIVANIGTWAGINHQRDVEQALVS